MLVEKVKQKLNGGSPKKSKQSDIESINRKTSRGQGMKPDKKLDVTSKNKSKSQSRSSSPRKKEPQGTEMETRFLIWYFCLVFTKPN